MPIVIKEIFSSDPISEALEKINFNFDQLILSGGGPPGPIGPIGLPGIAGPQGLRGDHWQIGGASGLLGFTGPTSDHGPNFGDLQDSDTWMDSGGNVWVWQGGATDSWVYSGVNLKGPTGLIGPSGGSTDLNMYLGSSGSANDVGSYIPSISIGPTSISQGHADFYILNKSNVNAFLIGDPSWVYNKLKNFSNLDYINGVLLSPSQRMIPKQTIIQSGIDYTGFGGFSIGAYGLTGATSTVLNDYVGGSSQASITSATGFFNAGWKIRLNSDSTYSHVFNLKTGFNDLEIQSGDALDPLLGNTTGKISIISKTIELKGSAGETDPIRFITNPTYSRFRDLLAVGFNTTTDTTLLPGIIAADGYNNLLIIGGNSRIHGVLRVGDRSTATNQIYIGTERLVDGNSEINFYAGTANTGLFQIKRESGINGKVLLYNTGNGHFSIVNTGGGNIDLYGSNSAWIGLRNIGTNTSGIDIQTSNTATSYVRFIDQTSAETARFDMATQRLGIGTTVPVTPLHVNGILGGTQASIATFSNKLNSSYTTIGTAGVLSDVPSWNSGSNILEFVSWNATGNGIISSYTGNLKFQTGGRQDRMIILEGGNVGIGTNTPIDKLQVVGGDISLDYGRSIRARGYDYSKLIETTYDGGIGADVTYIYTAGAVSSNQFPKITITSRGYVGIETTNPASKLHIKSTSNTNQDANIKLEGHIDGNQSIIDFYPFSYNTANVQDPTGRSIIGPSNDNLYGRLGVVGYRQSQNTTNADNRNLYITSERYKIETTGPIASRFRGYQSELGNIRVEAAGYINFRVNQYQLPNADTVAANAMPIVNNVDILTIVPGTGNYGTSAPYLYAVNTFPRIGINNIAPLAGYRLHIDGDTLLDGNLVFGGNALGGGTATNYSVKTLGAQPLRIGTNNKTNIFIRNTDGFVGIGNPSTTVIEQQIQAPLSPLQVTIPFTGSAIQDPNSPHSMKHNLGRFIGSMGDYERGIIMLHPASDGTTEIPFSMCCGKFYIVRGGVGPMMIIDTIEVDSASGHLSNRGVVKANMSHDADNGNYRFDETLRRDNVFLTTVQDVSGQWWVALYVGYVLQAHSVYFDGINNNSGWNGNYTSIDMYYWRTKIYPPGIGSPFPAPSAFFIAEAVANTQIFANKYIDYAPIAAAPGVGPGGYNINKYHQGIDVFSGIKFQNDPDDVTVGYIKNKFALDISFNTSINFPDPIINYNSGAFSQVTASGTNTTKTIGILLNRILEPNEHIFFTITVVSPYFFPVSQTWIADLVPYIDPPSFDGAYYSIYGLSLPSNSDYRIQIEGTIWKTYY